MKRQGSIPILKIGQILITSIQAELDDTAIDLFQNDILEAIEKNVTIGLVIDISSLDNVDSYVARKLADTGKMVKLMGTETVVVGIQPEVAATLVRMGFFFSGVHTSLSLEEGLELLKQIRQKKQE